MGNLLRYLRQPDLSIDVYLDFEDSIPTSIELPVYNPVKNILDESASILSILSNYQGSADQIRKAIANPNDDKVQEETWYHVIESVKKLQKVYQYSVRISEVVPDLLKELSGPAEKPIENIESKQSLCRLYADLISFVLKADQYKMTNPKIQNDFSYYRRTNSRKKVAIETDVEVKNEFELSLEDANYMSLFFASPTPFMNLLTQLTCRIATELKVGEVVESLANFGKICLKMIDNPESKNRMKNPDTIFTCIRTMAGIIIIYDHVHPQGVFRKDSPINLKSCIKAIKESGNDDLEALINVIRYTCKHMNDDSTPKSTKQLLLQL